MYLANFVVLLEDELGRGLLMLCSHVTLKLLDSCLMLILELLQLHELLADLTVLGEDHRVNLDFSLVLFACSLCQYVDYLAILLVVCRLELQHLLTHALHLVVMELFQV